GSAFDPSLLPSARIRSATVCPRLTPWVLPAPTGTCARDACSSASSVILNAGYNATRTSCAPAGAAAACEASGDVPGRVIAYGSCVPSMAVTASEMAGCMLEKLGVGGRGGEWDPG